MKPPRIVNPQFIWMQDGQNFRIDLGYFGSATLEHEEGKGYAIAFNNCGKLHPSPCTAEGGFIGEPRRYYVQDEYQAKLEALKWAKTIILEQLATLQALIDTSEP